MYGVWDRSFITPTLNDPNYDYLLGFQGDADWDEVEKTQGTYNWNYFQEILQQAYLQNKPVMLSIGPGPDAPQWIYQKGVPKVETNDGDHSWPHYPFYLHPKYKEYYFELVKQFAIFVRKQPQHLLDLISYVQVKTGCTGDEIHYKGTPLKNIYQITKEKWTAFRIECFEQWRVNFNEGLDKKIPLLFNEIDLSDNPAAFNWVFKNVKFNRIEETNLKF